MRTIYKPEELIVHEETFSRLESSISQKPKEYYYLIIVKHWCI